LKAGTPLGQSIVPVYDSTTIYIFGNTATDDSQQFVSRNSMATLYITIGEAKQGK
jgi:hypothetical protein